MKKINNILLPLILLFFCHSVSSAARGAYPRITDSVTIRVNMSYMVSNGSFDPSTDSVYINSDFSGNDTIAFLHRVDTSYIWSSSFLLYAGAVYTYNFGIRHASNTSWETADPLTRKFRMPDTLYSRNDFYSNYNPATIPIRFNCDMWYQIRAGHFTPTYDYLDVAGNFNNEGAGYTVLFPVSEDNLYSAVIFLDTAMLQDPLLKFRFRFNGNWETAELPGDSDRVYTLHDTTGNNPNVFFCWYNDIDPVVPALPIAYNVVIHGSLTVKQILTGNYNYEDYNMRPEGNTIYHWYHADSIGGPLITIDTTNGHYTDRINYVLDTITDLGKYIVFEVTPVTKAIGTDSLIGLPVRVYSSSKVVGVGISEHHAMLAKIYPNPVSDVLYVDPVKEIRKIDVLNMNGQVMMSLDNVRRGRQSMNLQFLPPGPYIMMLFGSEMELMVRKVIVQR